MEREHLQNFDVSCGHEPGTPRRVGFQPASSDGIRAARIFCGQGCPHNRQPRWLPYESDGRPPSPPLSAGKRDGVRGQVDEKRSARSLSPIHEECEICGPGLR